MRACVARVGRVNSHGVGATIVSFAHRGLKASNHVQMPRVRQFAENASSNGSETAVGVTDKRYHLSVCCGDTRW
jgi:hypothetical protein